MSSKIFIICAFVILYQSDCVVIKLPMILVLKPDGDLNGIKWLPKRYKWFETIIDLFLAFLKSIFDRESAIVIVAG